MHPWFLIRALPGVDLGPGLLTSLNLFLCLVKKKKAWIKASEFTFRSESLGSPNLSRLGSLWKQPACVSQPKLQQYPYQHKRHLLNRLDRKNCLFRNI